MTFEQVLSILEVFLAGSAPGLIFHLIGWAAKPWARGVLSILPDIVGMVRRLQGKAGAPGAPNVPGPPTFPTLLLLVLALPGCGGSRPPPEALAVCLVQMNEELAGQSTCEAIVRAISTVVARNEKCSELLLHGLRCTNGKDGG